MKITLVPYLLIAGGCLLFSDATAGGAELFDAKGFTGWTFFERTFEAICKGNSVEIIANGKSMNKIAGFNNSSGCVGLQSDSRTVAMKYNRTACFLRVLN